MPVPPGLKPFYRQLGWVEKLFLVLLAAYLLLSWLAPLSGFRIFTQLALTFAGVAVALRLARALIKRAIWRLRNRLIVTYLFIAVIPIVLILVLVGIGAYLLTGQIAVYLVSTELDRRTEALVGPLQGLLVTPPDVRADRIRWMAPYLEQRYPGIELLVRENGEWRYPETSSLMLPPEGWSDNSGVVFKDGHLCLWVYVHGQSGETVATVPLTRDFLAGLVPGLGQVTLVNPTMLQSPAGESRRPRSSVPPGAPQAGRQDLVPPSANRFDIEVPWFSWVPVAVWESPGVIQEGPLVVTSRGSAVLRTLFSPQVDWTQGTGFIIFVAVGSLFLLVELVSLFIGVSMTRTITTAVHNLYEGTQRVMQGDFSHRIEVTGNDQLGGLGSSFNRMTENLERLVRVEKEKERLQSEIEIAREVQSQLYPKTVPALERLELIAMCHPARIVSGDYYDYLALHDSKVALAIGDVAGKGISAALLMATVQSSLRTQIRACLEAAAAATASGDRAYDSVPTSRLVAQLNQQLYTFTSPEKFATFYFAVYDDSTGRLTYTNAGHPPPILVRDGEVMRLETNGMVVGAFPFAEYGESTIELASGDILFCFTDGITELENEYGEMFGEEALGDLLVRNSWRQAPDLIATVLATVQQWSNSPELQDDMTMLVARRR